MENPVPNQLSEEALAQFRLGIDLILSRWPMLQMAIKCEWGGPDSRQKADQLLDDIVSRFNQIIEPVCFDEVDGILYKSMISLDSSVDSQYRFLIAESVMVMHEECLEGNFTSIERLREADPGEEDFLLLLSNIGSVERVKPNLSNILSNEEPSSFFTLGANFFTCQ